LGCWWLDFGLLINSPHSRARIILQSINQINAPGFMAVIHSGSGLTRSPAQTIPQEHFVPNQTRRAGVGSGDAFYGDPCDGCLDNRSEPASRRTWPLHAGVVQVLSRVRLELRVA